MDPRIFAPVPVILCAAQLTTQFGSRVRQGEDDHRPANESPYMDILDVATLPCFFYIVIEDLCDY